MAPAADDVEGGALTAMLTAPATDISAAADEGGAPPAEPEESTNEGPST